jgi:steroid 5-alpha reductase family enzyme
VTSVPDGPDTVAQLAVEAPGPGVAEAPPPPAGLPGRVDRASRAGRLSVATALQGVRFAVAVYVASRLLLFLLAIVDGALRHHSLYREFENWDGGWYRGLATDGYPHHALQSQTTLGFFPLYPLLIWLVARPLTLFMAYGPYAPHAADLAGLFIALVGGGVAAVLVQRLAEGWWGESAGRRAVLLFCLFPGSVVFSMVYAEGVMLPLVVGCLLALERRRWLLAGILAAFATASEPEAAVLVLVCAVAAGRELHRRGWQPPAWRALIAPVLAPIGFVAVIAYLWARTGTPRAYWIAQHYGWDERFDPLALPHLAIRLSHQISFAHFNHPTINLNWPVGLIGAVVLAVLLVLMFRIRRTISPEAWVWTLGISFIAVTSEWVPPNPRLLITAFPAVIVLAYYCKGRRFNWLLALNTILLVSMSALTFVNVTLRP